MPIPTNDMATCRIETRVDRLVLKNKTTANLCCYHQTGHWFDFFGAELVVRQVHLGPFDRMSSGHVAVVDVTNDVHAGEPFHAGALASVVVTIDFGLIPRIAT